jgi:hypothetical protein
MIAESVTSSQAISAEDERVIRSQPLNNWKEVVRSSGEADDNFRPTQVVVEGQDE